MNKKTAISIVCVILALVSVAGIVFAVIPRNNDEPTETKDTQKAEESSFESDTDTAETGSKKEELTSPPEGHTPIPDLNDGNEIYLDIGVVDRLQQLEDAGMDDEVNLILDTMLLLINEFADREYSPLAIRQIQRFYIEFYKDIEVAHLDELCAQLAECISPEGLNKNDFASKVREQFGFDENIDYSYLYDAEA